MPINEKGRVRPVVAVDMDEVLVYISPEWYERMWAERGRLSEWFKLDEKLTPEQVLARDIYYLDVWLSRDPGGPPPEGRKAFMDLYSKHGGFYENLEPTPMCAGVGALAAQPFVEKVWVVTHTFPGMEEEKLDWLYSYLPANGKVEVLMPPVGTPKSVAMIGAGATDWTTLVDDSPAVLQDIVGSMGVAAAGREILVPQLGWTRCQETMAVVASAMAEMVFYDPRGEAP